MNLENLNKPEDQPPWEKLNKNQTAKIAARWSTLQMGKFVVLLIVFSLLSLQPLVTQYQKGVEISKTAENLKAEKQSESALELAKAAIAQVTLLSSQQGQLKAENESLRKESTNLKESFDILRKKYQELEASYALAIEEKKKLENRIDQLFRNQSDNLRK